MTNRMKNLDLILILLLIIFEISSFILFLLILIYTSSLDLSTESIKEAFHIFFYDAIINLILISFAIYALLVFGFHALICQIVAKLKWLIISSIAIPVLQWTTAYLIDKSNVDNTTTQGLRDIHDFQFYLKYILIAKTVCYVLVAVLTLILRRMIINEMTTLPLASIDEKLTEDLYKNILQQSFNPEDKLLKKEYKRLSVHKKHNMLTQSLSVGTDKSADYDNANSVRNVGSINNSARLSSPKELQGNI